MARLAPGSGTELPGTGGERAEVDAEREEPGGERAADVTALGRRGRALALIGFMGAGKSTFAQQLARELDVRALDTDALLQERFGHSVQREFELHGERAFRAEEEDLVCGLLDDAAAARGPAPWASVIALGGGAVLSSRVRAALAEHVTVLLDVDPELAWERMERAGDRPLARDRAGFIALWGERRELYEELADVYVPAAQREDRGAELARALSRALRSLGAAPAGCRLVWASARSGDYPVLVGRGLLDAGPGVWPLDRSRSRPYCVTDETVGALYGARLERLAAPTATVTIEPGEQHKTLACAGEVWSELAARGMNRADHVAAVGGGVVGDLAGFCAATYQRGVAVVHVPTTLVAQVDSAYGGKTGVDLPAAKNYVGAYHQPAAVLVDPAALATLPEPELAAGWVEVLKTALIAGGELWRRVTEGPPAIDQQTILDCARTKLAIVARDERDAGVRQVLNLGHTVGHAIETASGYERYRHGEAVGLGLLAALRLSGTPELREQVRLLLQARGLPTTLRDAGVELEQVLAASARDKKRVGAGPTPFVLVRAPGDVLAGCEVPEADLRGAVQELFAG